MEKGNCIFLHPEVLGMRMWDFPDHYGNPLKTSLLKGFHSLYFQCENSILLVRTSFLFYNSIQLLSQSFPSSQPLLSYQNNFCLDWILPSVSLDFQNCPREVSLNSDREVFQLLCTFPWISKKILYAYSGDNALW